MFFNFDTLIRLYVSVWYILSAKLRGTLAMDIDL